MGWSDATLVMLCGGVLGYALGVMSCAGWYLARAQYWRNRYLRARHEADRANFRSMLLRRQAE